MQIISQDLDSRVHLIVRHYDFTLLFTFGYIFLDNFHFQ